MKPYSLGWWIDCIAHGIADMFMIPLLVRAWVWVGAWDALLAMPVWVSIVGFVVAIAAGVTAKSLWVHDNGLGA